VSTNVGGNVSRFRFVSVVRARYVRITRAHEQTERLRRVTRIEELFDGASVVALIVMGEAVPTDVVSVRHFAKRRDFVAQAHQGFRQRADALAFEGVIRLGAVPRGIRPVSMAVRLGAQAGEAMKARVSNMPSAASRCMFGVRTSVAP